MLSLRDAVRSGKRGRELFDDDSVCGAAIKFGRGVDRMVAVYEPAVERGDIEVTLHYGPPGTGKTFCCDSEDAYYYDGDSNGFWNGYEGQSKVIFDEFGGHVLKPKQLQRVLDKYRFTANIKGGSVPFKGTDIHICSNYLPRSWWKEGTQFQAAAIYRRITVVHWHYAYKKIKLFRHGEREEDGELKEENWAMTKFLAAYNAATFVPPDVNH